jgi:hypothetical protein
MLTEASQYGCQKPEASPAPTAEFHSPNRFKDKQQQFPSVQLSLLNRHADVQGSRALAETPGPLHSTKFSETSCNKLSTIND